MTTAMLHNTRRTFRPCFFGWLQIVEVNQKTKKQKQVTLNRWAKQSAHVCIKCWVEIILEKKNFQRKGLKVIQMMMNSGLVSCMEKWKADAKKSKSSKSILARVVLNMQQLHIRKALHGWMFKVDLAIARKELLRKVAGIWWCNLIQKYFELWLDNSKSEAELRHKTATEGVPPAWKPPRHEYDLKISAAIQNLVSDGIGKVGLTFCGLNTTSEISYLDFEGCQTAQCTLKSYTHLGKITAAVLETLNQKLRFGRIDVFDETMGVQYLFLEIDQQTQPNAGALSGVLKAADKFRKQKTLSGADSDAADKINASCAEGQKRKFLPAGDPSIVADPRPPPVVKKLSYAFDTPNQLKAKIQSIEKWLRRSVIDINLLHTATSTNMKALDLYLEYSPSDAKSILSQLSTIFAFCKSFSSRRHFVQAWKAGRSLTFLSLVALQRRRFQTYCLQLNFLWSRISSHHIREQYIQSWKAAFDLLNYLRVRSTPIVLARNQCAANVLLRGLKRFKSIMYYRKWMKWKSRLKSWMIALLPRMRWKSAMYLKRFCSAKFGAHRKKFESFRISAKYIVVTIKADAVSRRIQRMYLHGLNCVRLIQSYIRVQFQKKVRAKVSRLLHEREQRAIEELRKMTELKALLEQCHSPEPSAAYWRKYGKTENPEDIKQMKLNWASMQSIVQKTSIPLSKNVHDVHFSEPEHGIKAETYNDRHKNEDVDCSVPSGAPYPEQLNTTKLQCVRASGHHLGLSPFLRRIEDANQRAAELRKHSFGDILKLQRSARGFQTRQLVEEMKLEPAKSPDPLGTGSQEFSLPEIRAVFRHLRNGECPDEVTDWVPPIKGMFVPTLSKNASDQKRVPNPPSTFTRTAQTLLNFRSNRLASKKM